ncbi:MAG: MSMEG_1061 family FMN-dependent PPOX-type flavoprotein [Hyphomicrobiaceae bacterium]
MQERFEETIRTRERLRELHGTAKPASALKAIDHIDDICRRFIAASPFVMVGSRGADGRLDLSPKGDPAGFVRVLDEHTLAIPDRLGNNRLDTFENLLVNPEVGLFFLIPGNGDTLRVSGKGQIVRDSRLQSQMAVNGKAPNVVLIVNVEEAFLHCPKCMVRAALWKQDLWPNRSNVPTLGEALVTHSALGESVADVQARIDNDGATRLY